MPPTVQYELAMPRPETHLFEVRARIEGIEGGAVEFSMPAWAPGSYMVRDFARHVQDFEARAGGRRCAWERVGKHTWRVDAGTSDEVEIRYKVYANDLSVQTSHLDATHGFLNGTSVFMYLRGAKHLPCAVRVRPPKGWRVDTGLPGRGNLYRARDYDHLADCPFEIGTHRRLAFKVRGKEHVVALYGHGNEDAERIRRDLQRIVEEEAAVFGGLPYDRYVFIIHLQDKRGGGLEHENSNTSAVDRFSFQPDKRYQEDFLALEAHEFFHTWNVKRIRPVVLGPFDYDREVHTTLLWAMEGLTSYYDHLVLARAGLITEDRFREYVGELITKLREHPGRFKMSLEDSSFLTWVKLYKMDENWPNTGISYYLKGELVGLLLDLAIRERTKNRRSLDDVFKLLWERHGKTGVGIDEAKGWRAALEDATGLKWGPFWRDYISGTKDLDFERALRAIGWTVKAVRKGEDKDAAKKGEYAGPGGWLGIQMKTEDGRVKVKHVVAGSPAERAGVNAGDELVAVDGFQVEDPDALSKRMRERAPGERVTLTIFRRKELCTLRTALGENPPEKWRVEADPKATAAQKRMREKWLASLARP